MTIFIEIVKAIVKDVVAKTSVPLSILIAGWVLLSPNYNNFIQLIQKVEAQEKRFDEHRESVEHIEKLIKESNERLSEIKTDLGIIKYRIERIEKGK